MALQEQFQILYRLLKATSEISSGKKMQNLADLAAYIIKCLPANSIESLLMVFDPNLSQALNLGPVFLSNPGRFGPPDACHVPLLAFLHDSRVQHAIHRDVLIPIVQNLYRLANSSLKGVIYLVSSPDARDLLQKACPAAKGFDEPASYIENRAFCCNCGSFANIHIVIEDLEIDSTVEKWRILKVP